SRGHRLRRHAPGGAGLHRPGEPTRHHGPERHRRRRAVRAPAAGGGGAGVPAGQLTAPCEGGGPMERSRRHAGHSTRYRLLIVAAALCAAGVRAPAPAAAASAIETTYRATGSWAVSTGSVSAYGGTYTLFYPTNLGANGFKHPILTWGNGTNAT